MDGITQSPDLSVDDDLLSDSQQHVQDEGGESHLPEHNETEKLSHRNELNDKITSAARKAYRDMTGDDSAGGDGPARTAARPTNIPKGQRLGGSPSPQGNQQGNQQRQGQQHEQPAQQQTREQHSVNEAPPGWNAQARAEWSKL